MQYIYIYIYIYLKKIHKINKTKWGWAEKKKKKKFDTLLDLCVSSLRRGHANLLCIFPILVDDRNSDSRC